MDVSFWGIAGSRRHLIPSPMIPSTWRELSLGNSTALRGEGESYWLVSFGMASRHGKLSTFSFPSLDIRVQLPAISLTRVRLLCFGWGWLGKFNSGAPGTWTRVPHSPNSNTSYFGLCLPGCFVYQLAQAVREVLLIRPLKPSTAFILWPHLIPWEV